MTRIFKMAALVLLSLVVVACARTDQDPVKEPVLIGLSFDSLVVERWQRDMEIIVANAQEAGYEVDVQIANENIDRQIEQIEEMIASGVKVLIILPNDSDSLIEVVLKAKRQGIYVIAYDRLIKGVPIDLYISFDNKGIGRAMAKALIDASAFSDDKSQIDLVIINGDPKDNNAHLLNEGYYEIIQPLVDSGRINLVKEVWANEWREDIAQAAVEEVLLQGGTLNAVVAANDVLATGAIQVLSELKLAGEVIVVSQDAELSACQRIVEETQLATIYKPINDLAVETVNVAVQVLQGSEVPYGEVIWNGAVDVPFRKLDFHVVDIDSINEIIIESGFHSKEDVYLHVNE